MTVEEALEFLDTYTRRYTHLDITRMQDFMARLGDPQKQLKFIHVAGTNGKGSCSAMCASILRKAGYKTGLFTSPHIIRFNERIQINGEMIPDEELAGIIGEVKAVNDGLETERKVNWFEFITAVGMIWFARQKCDIVVLEVGMGGEFDGTNVIDVPECAVIMNIGLDHVEQLGGTLPEIACAKAGIIKQGGDVVIYRGPAEVEEVFEKKCAAVKAKLHKADFDSIVSLSSDLNGQSFELGDFRKLRIPLAGAHQLRNAAVVYKVMTVLRRKGWKITRKNMREGFADTEWPVRFEIVHTEPTFIIDGGHNPQCLEAVKEGLLKLVKPETRIVFLTGILKDKDTSTMSGILSTVSREFVLVTPPSYRAMPAEELAELFRAEGVNPTCCETIGEGIETAMRMAGKDGVVCCVGSLYLAGDVKAWFLAK